MEISEAINLLNLWCSGAGHATARALANGMSGYKKKPEDVIMEEIFPMCWDTKNYPHKHRAKLVVIDWNPPIWWEINIRVSPDAMLDYFDDEDFGNTLINVSKSVANVRFCLCATITLDGHFMINATKPELEAYLFTSSGGAQPITAERIQEYVDKVANLSRVRGKAKRMIKANAPLRERLELLREYASYFDFRFYEQHVKNQERKN